MERLTKQDVVDIIQNKQTIARNIGKTVTTKLLNEMLEYKSIEERFNINLITLFRCIMEGFWFKKFKDEDEQEGNHELVFACPSKHTKVNFWYNTIEILITPKFYIDCNKKIESLSETIEGEVFFEDYGKTWALTKEELL